MKKIIALSVITMIVAFQSIVGITQAKNTYRPKSSHSYISGPRGGCYYINSNGNKTYVDRSLCK